MIEWIKGNIFDSKCEALVNLVNLNGISGKGLALEFKKRFPLNFKSYVIACRNLEIDIGKCHVFKNNYPPRLKYIINFPTKRNWQKNSEYEFVEKGLENLLKIIEDYRIISIAMVSGLGCGCGGLNYNKVKKMLEECIKKIPENIKVEIYTLE